MSDSRDKHKEHMYKIDVDCEQLIQKHLEAGVHPLAICGVLIGCASELCKRGPIKKKDFLSMVESTWNLFDDVEESLKVMH